MYVCFWVVIQRGGPGMSDLLSWPDAGPALRRDVFLGVTSSLRAIFPL